jgi:hypothetical protein
MANTRNVRFVFADDFAAAHLGMQRYIRAAGIPVIERNFALEQHGPKPWYPFGDAAPAIVREIEPEPEPSLPAADDDDDGGLDDDDDDEGLDEVEPG